ncbi:MAG: aminopeptidase P family protein [Bacteroidales bacterium]|nr:aminopeptidase P family protein [Bacteroidales bacterium]
MFDKKVYAGRRNTLLDKMGRTAAEGKRGIAIFIGNAESPAQYKDNCYKWRQDSSWLYFWGLDEPLYAAILDLDSGKETIFADDQEIDDIVWSGPLPSVKELAASVGVTSTAPYRSFDSAVLKAFAQGRRVHFLPPSRYFNMMRLMELTGWTPEDIATVAPGEGSHASRELVEAVVSMRLIKEECEIAEIDAAADIGIEMHTVGRNSVKPGILEQEIVGKMEGVTLSKGWGVSFPTILTQHGETLHNHLHDKIVEPGKLLVIDAGAESNSHYASDFTRTLPTGGKFTPRQRDIYQIVCDANELAFSLTRPGIAYRDVHIASARVILEGLKDLGLVKGSLEDMVNEGIAGMFMPHGLGHNIGLDVHDMEDLGENFVGYDPDQTRSPQLGLGNLRMARVLKPGHFISDEPGIYFIPALIEQWKKEGLDKGFVNFGRLEEYYEFGGIRLEDDVLVTENGARRTGSGRLPIQPDDVEASMQ